MPWRLMQSLLVVTVAIFMPLIAPLKAQFPVTQLTGVYPFGGQAGTTFDVTITGQELDEPTELYFSHPGITAKQSRSAAVDGKPGEPVPRQFTVTIAGDVPRGNYEVRVNGYYGLSNPRVFAVDNLPEILESEPNQPREKAQPINLESVVNGRIEAEKSDCFAVPLKQGQRVLIECMAFRADSQLDGTLVITNEGGNEVARANDTLRRDPLIDLTVPRDGTYVIALYDFLYKGGDNHSYRLTVSTRPRIDFVFPPSALPGTKGVFTLYGRNLAGGQKTALRTPDGGLLETLEVEIEIPLTGESSAASAIHLEPHDLAGECYIYRRKFGDIPANPVPIYLAQAPVTVEQEPNNDHSSAQTITTPCEVVGRFQQINDQDVFSFAAVKGEVFNFEVLSERLAQNTDPYLIVQRVIKNEQGGETVSEVAGVDEAPKSNQPQSMVFDTGSADAVYKLTVPETGTYRLVLRDLYYQTRGNSQYLYRLIVRRPTPSFRLIATCESPRTQQDGNRFLLWSPVVLRGGTQGVRVQAQRQDDFKGQIRVRAEGLPAGVTCSELLLGGDADQGMLMFSAAEDAPAWHGPIKIIGVASDGERAMTRTATVAVITWGTADRNQTPPRARIAGDLALSVMPHELQPCVIQLSPGVTLETSVAGKLEIPVKVLRRGDFKEAVKLTALTLPKDIKLPETDIAADKTDGKVVLDVKNSVTPGEYSFAIQCSGKLNNYRRNPGAVDKVEQSKQRLVNELQAVENEIKAAKEKQSAEPTKQAAEVMLKELMQRKMILEQEIVAVEKRLKEVQENSKSKTVNVVFYAQPVTVKIVRSPVEVSTSGERIDVKAGQKNVELPLKIVRRFGFDDEVRLTMAVNAGLGTKLVNAVAAKGIDEQKLTFDIGPSVKPGEYQIALKVAVTYNSQSVTYDLSIPVQVIE